MRVAKKILMKISGLSRIDFSFSLCLYFYTNLWFVADTFGIKILNPSKETRPQPNPNRNHRLAKFRRNAGLLKLKVHLDDFSTACPPVHLTITVLNASSTPKS